MMAMRSATLPRSFQSLLLMTAETGFYGRYTPPDIGSTCAEETDGGRPSAKIRLRCRATTVPIALSFTMRLNSRDTTNQSTAACNHK